MPELTLNKAMLDWLTLTTFQGGIHHDWTKYARKLGKAEPQKRLQYTGYTYPVRIGSLFIGLATQRKKLHGMVQITGEAANEHGYTFGGYLKPPTVVKCTRIDLQITAIMPARWQQIHVFNRLHKRNPSRVVEFRESGGPGDTKLNTIYFGSRQSARFTRIYMKPGEDMMLRFETQYGGDRAHHMATKILLRQTFPAGYLRHELEKTIGDYQLNRLFVPLLANADRASETMVTESDIERTESWLVANVLASFERVINAHESDGKAFDAFKAAIDRKIESDANSAAESES